MPRKKKATEKQMTLSLRSAKTDDSRQMISSDNVDAEGTAWATVGENIRKGAKKIPSINVLKEDISELKEDISELKEDLTGLLNENLNKSFTWKIGSFVDYYNGNNGPYTNDDNRFITMQTFYKLPFDAVVYIDSNFLYYLYELTEEGENQFINKQTINGFNQKLWQSGVNTIKANTYFRLDVRYQDLSTVDDINYLLNAIHITSYLYYNEILKAKTIRTVKTVGSQNCDFTSLITAIKYAVSQGNVTLELSNETFDVSNEVDYVNDKEGIKIGN